MARILGKDATFENLPSSKTASLIDGQALVQVIGKPVNSYTSTFGDLADVCFKDSI